MNIVRERLNYYCILGEGLFNTIGLDLLGITSIMPLFLSSYGASLGLIGLLTTVQGAAAAVVPLLSGGFAARVKSKRKLSMLCNGIARSLILLVPVSLLLGLPNTAVLGVFAGVFILFSSIQPVAGLAWSYLLNDCLNPHDRPKLLGVIFAISGVVGFGASGLIKVIRDSQTLPDNMKYFCIFGLSGLFLASSVLWFLPLRESRHETILGNEFSVSEYMASLTRCFRNKDFNRMLGANVVSYTSMLLNAFLYIYAASVLKLQSNLVSNMIIAQTVGQIVGGVVTGQVSARLGVKRMLVMSECAGLLVPLLELLSPALRNAYPAMCAAVFFYGMTRSGSIGYMNYLVEAVEKDKIIFHMVTKGLVMLPVSFLSTAAGIYIQGNSMAPIFLLQAALSCAAIILCMRLRLIPRS